jgi:hypothetical protein
MPGAWAILEQDFARHPPTYIVDVHPGPKSAYYPVKNFPILAKLLKERYQPVVRTADGVIYRMRDGESPESRKNSAKKKNVAQA